MDSTNSASTFLDSLIDSFFKLTGIFGLISWDNSVFRLQASAEDLPLAAELSTSKLLHLKPNRESIKPSKND